MDQLSAASKCTYSTLFIDTSLGTHMAMLISDSEIVSDLKEQILREHIQCFPNIGDIKIDALKIKRRGCFYHLVESMVLKHAFDGINKTWFLSVDATRVEKNNETTPTLVRLHLHSDTHQPTGLTLIGNEPGCGTQKNAQAVENCTAMEEVVALKGSGDEGGTLKGGGEDGGTLKRGDEDGGPLKGGDEDGGPLKGGGEDSGPLKGGGEDGGPPPEAAEAPTLVNKKHGHVKKKMGASHANKSSSENMDEVLPMAPVVSQPPFDDKQKVNGSLVGGLPSQARAIDKRKKRRKVSKDVNVNVSPFPSANGEGGGSVNTSKSNEEEEANVDNTKEDTLKSSDLPIHEPGSDERTEDQSQHLDTVLQNKLSSEKIADPVAHNVIENLEGGRVLRRRKKPKKHGDTKGTGILSSPEDRSAGETLISLSRNHTENREESGVPSDEKTSEVDNHSASMASEKEINDVIQSVVESVKQNGKVDASEEEKDKDKPVRQKATRKRSASKQIKNAQIHEDGIQKMSQNDSKSALMEPLGSSQQDENVPPNAVTRGSTKSGKARGTKKVKGVKKKDTVDVMASMSEENHIPQDSNSNSPELHGSLPSRSLSIVDNGGTEGTTMTKTENQTSMHTGNDGPSRRSLTRKAKKNLSRTSTMETRKSSEHGISIIGTQDSIFKVEQNERSPKEDTSMNSSHHDRTPDTSLSSDYSDGKSDGSYILRRKDSGANNVHNTVTKDMALDDILRSSSQYKKAKLIASQSQDDDLEFEHVDHVLETQGTQASTI